MCSVLQPYKEHSYFIIYVFSANKVFAALSSWGFVNVNSKISSSVSISIVKVALLLHIGMNIMWCKFTVRYQGH